MHISFVSPANYSCEDETDLGKSDVLRRRFQVNTMSGMGFQYTSVGNAIATILRQEGFVGLYKGIVPNLLKVAPSMAASWYTFESCRDLLVWLAPQKPEPV